MSLHRGYLPWQKLTQKIAILTCACRQTVAGLLFIFVDHGTGIRRATYLCLDCAKNVDKNWNITFSFIIIVNFDHVWAEHYPVTLNNFQFRTIWLIKLTGAGAERCHLFTQVIARSDTKTTPPDNWLTQ